jgi:tetratricopeptide (TPR) repeat protein
MPSRHVEGPARLRAGLLALLALAAAVPALAAPPARSPAPRVDHLELAALLIRDGHADRAAAVLAQVDLAAPGLDRRRFHTLAGIVAARRSDHAAAVRHLELAIRHGETDPRLTLQIAQSRFELRDHRGALTALARVRQAAAARWGAWLIRAQAHWALGERMGAFSVLYEGRALHPGSLALQRQLVHQLIQTRLHLQALDEGRRLLGLPGATLDDALGVAEALRRSGQADAAVRLLEVARLSTPWNRQLLVQLARCHLEAGRPLSAATLLHRAADLDPGLRVEAAELYRRAGKLGLAMLLNQQVTDQPRKVRQRLGLLMELGRFEEAAALQPVLSRLGLLSDPEIRFAIGYTLARIGRLKDAEAQLASIDRPSLFERVVELRRVIAACREGAGQCAF